MMEGLSLLLATPIAKIILDEFYKGLGSKLGEQVIQQAKVPIQKIGELAWNRCFKARPQESEKLLQAGAAGEKSALQQIRNSLLKEMKNPDFASEVRLYVEQIRECVSINEIDAKKTMQVFGGQGFQNNDAQAPVIQGVHSSPIHISYTTYAHDSQRND